MQRVYLISSKHNKNLDITVEKGRGLQAARGGHPCRKPASQEGGEKENKPTKTPPSPTHLHFASTKDQSNEIKAAIMVTFLHI